MDLEPQTQKGDERQGMENRQDGREAVKTRRTRTKNDDRRSENRRL